MRDQMKITVIATGFDQARQTLKEFTAPIHKIETEQKENAPVLGDNDIPSEGENDAWDIPAFLRNRN